MSRPHLVSSSELSALRDLELVARTTIEGLRQGLHRSPFHGYSAEFSQYRHYRPGDDLKYVDWKAFGRTDRLYTRQFRETTDLSTLFVVDVSRSMDFPQSARSGRPSGRPTPTTKFSLARAVTAVLATLAIDQGDAAGLLAVSDAATYVPPRSGRHHLHVFLAALARLAPTGAAVAGGALRRAGSLLRRRGLVVVVSDFYEEQDMLAEVRRLARMGHDVIVIQVLSREEVDLEHLGAGEFVDLETGARQVVDLKVAARAYQRTFGSFVARVAREVRREGLDYLRLVTGEVLEPALRRFLIHRRAAAHRT
jgi:uncharacterized protein (DUF58 family)